jgi:putative ABC transport system permease protein
MEEFFGIISMDDLAISLLVAVGLILLALLVLGWRNRVLVRLGLRNIPRRRAQTVLIVFGLMLSTLIIAAAFGTGDTMTHSFRAMALDELGEVDEIVSLGGTLSLGGEMGFDDEEGGFGAGEALYFSLDRFESLAGEIRSLQAADDAQARQVEALTPALVEQGILVINRTARQSKLDVSVVGYDPATADDFDELFTSDGGRVRVVELGAGEVYLNQVLAGRLAAEPGHALEIRFGRASLAVTVRAVVKAGGLPGQLIMPLDQVQAALKQSGKINAILVSNAGGPYAGRQHSSAVTDLLKRVLNSESYQVQTVKYFYLFAAELMGNLFTTMFIGFGSFSIAAALLLIFLIFVMLAAERLREMGMARAVGTQRPHLVQMFVFEGAAYDLAAAAVGALMGTLVGLATVGFLARSFESIGDLGGFRLRYHLEPRSIIVAYCIGVLLTFVTVTISSWRVSRLNIVSAIRELPPPPNPDEGLRALLAQPWRVLGEALRQLLRLRLHRVLKCVLWDGPASSVGLFWALTGRGPLVVVLGLLSMRAGQGLGSAFFFDMGVSLVLIGLGLTIRWVLRVRRTRPERRDRIAFSFAGIGLLIYWALPADALDFLPDLEGGPEMFVLSGVMMVAGAVWTIIYNSDLLLGLVSLLLSPFSSLLPVVRTAIAYPMSSKFRTGMTIAMFALVIFMMVFISVFVHIVSQALDVGDLPGSGDFDIRANVSEANRIPSLQRAIAESPELDAADYVGFDRFGSAFLVKLAEGVDAQEAARALESAFLDYGMETVVIAEELESAKRMMSSILGLFQAFMGLGLVVGSASIGIVSTRAVVERRQQIGVLRSIGYQPWMVQWSFLLEASFVALLGILIGIGQGVILAYNFYNSELAMASGAGLSFAIPWTTLGIIVLIAYAASLLTTFLPSWQAARIYPAEALRYE